MTKLGIIALLRERMEGENRSPEARALERLGAALSSPRSFDELEWELPPKARYLGPGVWINAIKDGVPRDGIG
jgi:hypothetical protein